MPVIDWIRTDLDYPLPDGTSTLRFEKIHFAWFDCRVLNRRDAEKDYTADELRRVAALDNTIAEAEKERLVDTIIVKTQGFIDGGIDGGAHDPVGEFNRLLKLYEGIDRDGLRHNLCLFLSAVMPVCREWGVDMCIHPDDPPYGVLGLPRIVTGAEDIEWILRSVDDPRNGLTFCAGSLSSGVHNDVRELARRFASRTRFVHLRSTDTLPGGDFIEAGHLEGRGELIELVRIFEKENPSLPMRVDHGRLMLGDADKGYNPGYSFHGRMYALAQMDGVMATVKNEIENQMI
jgi:mannonate dehydratase